jgi:hypothetical protein
MTSGRTSTALEARTCKLCVACECAEPGCKTSLWVRFADHEYAARRTHHYVVAPGHPLAGAARVVIRDDEYEVVCEWQ